nr:alpha/beta hydrolase [uncultured Roseateles sp.]
MNEPVSDREAAVPPLSVPSDGRPASPRRRLLFAKTAAVVAAPLAVAGCGGGADDEATPAGAASTPTRFAETGGRKLSYRSVGKGKPIVLCNRFRGVLDWWDPAFIDGLAAKGFQVVYFDYTGMGQSTGQRTYDFASLAKDAKDLIDALGLKDVVIGGWSVGGIAAQVHLAMYGNVSHVLLIGTTPPGLLVKTADPAFFAAAAQPVVDLEGFTTSFFEPTDTGSRAAAKLSWDRIAARTGDRSPEVPVDWAVAQLATLPSNPVFPSDAVLSVLKSTNVPILHLGGDHDLAFPVENWYALNRQLPTLNVITYPRSGHGPHQQRPEAAASDIAAFIGGTNKS